jgi:hypothetical protein
MSQGTAEPDYGSLAESEVSCGTNSTAQPTTIVNSACIVLYANDPEYIEVPKCHYSELVKSIKNSFLNVFRNMRSSSTEVADLQLTLTARVLLSYCQGKASLYRRRTISIVSQNITHLYSFVHLYTTVPLLSVIV